VSSEGGKKDEINAQNRRNTAVGKRLDIYFWCRLGFNAPLLGLCGGIFEGRSPTRTRLQAIWPLETGSIPMPCNQNSAAFRITEGTTIPGESISDTTRQQHLL
jgi:hypothetical protein